MPKRSTKPATQSKNSPKAGGLRTAARGVAATESPFEPEAIRLIRLQGGKRQEVRVPTGQALRRAAMEWTYIVRNRRRWANVDSVVAEQAARIRVLAERLQIPWDGLEALASAEVVEVEVPYVQEDRAWEGRVFPWEHVLAAGTREFRNSRPLTVVRRLRRQRPFAATPRPVRNVLFVEATPGTLGEEYSFDAEWTLVNEAFKGAGATVSKVSKASLKKLAAAVRTHAPEVIHIAGCDTHQAAELLERPNPEHDGVCLDGEDGRPYDATPMELARAIRNEKAPPLLVSFNLLNSAARTAAMVVAEGGAQAAIGFQDSFSERFAEEFFAKLYWAIAESGGEILAGFRFAWVEIRSQLQASAGAAGTGIVLWGAQSWLGSPSAAQIGVADPLQDKARVQRAAPIPSSAVRLDIQQYRELNYSILHNRQRLFETFKVSKPLGRLENLDVSVQLYAGQEQIPFDQRFTIENETAELRDQITVPLTSTLMRTLRESVRSTLRVEVKHESTLLYYKTLPVNLLAIDEWKDDDENRAWLPSFVLPRDPAVLRVVDAAQKYLSALVDDAAAGFDGYQSVDPASDEPFLGIDQQAQALWWAIVSDFHPSYVNPPPTYSGSSQRLRTPSDVIDGKRGTCIDLALLYAACLEYVEIYPAIFLLESHAFPAYWRSDTAYQEFRQVRAPESEEDQAPEQRTLAEGAQAQSQAWNLQKPQYREILQSVRAGHLVPIETVFLTSRASFAEALDEGLANLRSRAEFNSMLDVRLAREAGVTPLPFRGIAS